MKILTVASAWKGCPPNDYGGSESVVADQIDALSSAGHHVHLVTVGSSRTHATETSWLYPDGMYHKYATPERDRIAREHMEFALEVAEAGEFDLIHDHTGGFETLPQLRRRSKALPPAVHTLHNGVFDAQLSENRREDGLSFICISESQRELAPPELRPYIAGVAHNGIRMASYPFRPRGGAYFMTLARFCKDKGQALAARICHNREGYRLVMAGNVASVNSWERYREVLTDSADPLHQNADFDYFRREVVPYLGNGVEYTGCVGHAEKLNLLEGASALLFPIDWEEPFGLAVIEALATGTPVVAMARGAMPELIDHGRTGFLARNEREFARYMERVGEIDPEVCRRSVEEKFSIEAVTRDSVELYERIAVGETAPRKEFARAV